MNSVVQLFWDLSSYEKSFLGVDSIGPIVTGVVITGARGRLAIVRPAFFMTSPPMMELHSDSKGIAKYVKAPSRRP